LYTLKSGDEIVAQLYNFIDKGGRAVALRPELTPTPARMIAAHQKHYKKPIKWFAIPQLFRYERQQKGRLREHFQFNADIIGETHPAADAELIALLIDILREFGLTAHDFVVRLSSRNAWHDFYHKRCKDPSRAYEFYQAVDKLDRDPPETTGQKLQQLGFSLQEIRDFICAARPTPELEKIIEDLSARGLSQFVKVDYGIVRGLAYYTGPVFEAFDLKGEFRAIAGGGRYDSLVKLISHGKVDLPALGFGMGDVVLTRLLEQKGLLPKSTASRDVFFIVEEESLRSEMLRLVQICRDAGLSVEFELSQTKPDKQFKRALELRANHVARLHRDSSGTVLLSLRDMLTRTEVVVEPAKILTHLGQARSQDRSCPKPAVPGTLSQPIN
ncbi:MAG: ATP phosphoribosyltransferase regulatory subunit, partial [Verrucomicrobiae bacterium]|nr:ATP phosphoribosyltransferase regulatory subunit [Verrucomicrobiae bacterium]